MYTEQMYKNSLCHYGVKGQKWGNRQYQNQDGTLTALGERRRLELLARTGNRVTPNSIAANRQAVARTGQVVRVNAPISRPPVSSSQATSLKPVSTVVKKQTKVINTDPTLTRKVNKSTIKARPTTQTNLTTDLNKNSKLTSSEMTNKTSSKRKKTTKKTKAQKAAEAKLKQQQEQQSQEEKKNENENQTQLSDEQVQDLARRVIRGEFGNGQVRKDKLGANYGQVQALVNAILLKGKKK